jgi:hypothetical protein
MHYYETRGDNMTKPLCLLLLLIAIASASDDKTDRATLKGVKAVCVVVEVADEAQARLGKEKMQTEIEKKLGQAGIQVDKNATTCLYLNERSLQAIGRQAILRKEKLIALYAVDLRLEFLQTVALTRDPTIKTYAPTWSITNMATVSADELTRTALDITDGLMGQFITAYKSVNPQ